MAPGRGHGLRGEAEIPEVSPAGQLELQAYEVDVRDGLGDRVLDLQAGVGLDEGEATRCRLACLHEELECPDSLVAENRRHLERGLEQLVAKRGFEGGARRDFDHLLMAPLERALALPEMHEALAIPRDLNLDMPGRGHPLLGVDFGAAEIFLGLGAAARIGFIQCVAGCDSPHAPTAAPRNRFDEQGTPLPERTREGLDLRQGSGPLGSAQNAHAAFLGKLPGLGLVAESVQGFGFRPHEDQPGLLAQPCKPGGLAQKAITRMDCVAARLHRPGHDLLGVEVGRSSATAER